jgi:hypothetical protein
MPRARAGRRPRDNHEDGGSETVLEPYARSFRAWIYAADVTDSPADAFCGRPAHHLESPVQPWTDARWRCSAHRRGVGLSESQTAQPEREDNGTIGRHQGKLE